eukprot:13846648-Alexandrium_andersonii.AAC.1
MGRPIVLSGAAGVDFARSLAIIHLEEVAVVVEGVARLRLVGARTSRAAPGTLLHGIPAQVHALLQLLSAEDTTVATEG